jgi:N-methylhydantoinase B
MLLGDLGAQWAAAALGAREVAVLAGRHGDGFLPGALGLIDLSERMTRAALARAPDGRGAWSDQLDGDGVSAAPVRIVVAIDKQGDQVTLDFTGSAPQTRGPVNASPAAMLAAALFFMRSLAPEAPNNAGCLRPLRFILPPGSVVNPDYPAAVNARTATVKMACNAILCAWGGLGAEGSMAANAGVATVVAVGGERADGTPYFYTEIIASGAGASYAADGESGISTDVGNARNTPGEVLEAEAPVLLERYEIRAGSGGAGLHQGGHGVRRAYRLLEGQARLSYRGERHATQAQGSHGGAPGARSAAWIERADGQVEPLPARAQCNWLAGDRLVIETAGGGGWGRPLQGKYPHDSVVIWRE